MRNRVLFLLLLSLNLFADENLAKRLILAYPLFLEKYEDNFIYFKDGSKLQFSTNNKDLSYEEIRVSRMAGTYTKTLAKISKFKLLLLDDFGVSALRSDEVNDLFEIIEDRVFNGSIIITAQLPIKDWHAYLGNETIADAMMDRLIHTAHKLELKGGSMREYLAKK